MGRADSAKGVVLFAVVLFAVALSSYGCGRPTAGKDQKGTDDHAALSEQEHSAVMKQEADSILAPILAETSGKPPVIELDEIVRRVGADANLRQRLHQPVTVLNAMLVRLRELHGRRDQATTINARKAIDEEARWFHVHADAQENTLHNLLTPAQHNAYHAYLEERLRGAGLPPDNVHGGGFGTAGALDSLGHEADSAHRPPGARPRRN